MLRKKIFQIVIILIIVTFFLYIINSINISEIISDLAKVDTRLIALSMTLVFLSFTLSAYRWQIIIKEIKADQSSKFFNCLGFCSVGFLMGLIIPSRIGYYGKAPLLAKYDHIPLSKGISAVNIETLQDFSFLILATVISILILIGYHQSSTILSNSALLVSMIAVTLVFSILFFHPTIILKSCKRLQDALSRMKDSNWVIRRVKNIFFKIVQLIEDTHDLLLKRQFMGELFIITIIFQIITVLGFYCVILSMGKSISIIYLFAILFISTVIGIISMIPGGFGSLDLSLIFFLQAEGASLSESVDIVVLWRFCIILPIFLVASIFFIKTNFMTPNE